ncbi:MAG: GntR family transcriptional regulator [Candidatus Cyclobacteriaceae bacterium M3_2C_046]
MEAPRYKQLQNNLKKQILSGIYKDGDLLPSENELSQIHQITRSTVRQALNELVREGYIIKRKGKGSIVRNRKTSLGLLSIKGFSDVVKGKKHTVNTTMLESPQLMAWPEDFFYPLNSLEQGSGCIYFKRLRCVEEDPVMLEYTYLPNFNLPQFCNKPLVNGSLFQTLNVNYQVEVVHVEQDLRALSADPETAGYLQINSGNPILHIILKFVTNRPELNIYSTLLCNTATYSIGNLLDEQ